MPRIPTLYPQIGAAILQEPRVPVAPPPTGNIAITEGLGTFGETAIKVSQNLDAQAAELEYVKGAFMYDAGVDAIEQDVFRDPNVKDYPSEFVKRVKELEGQISQTMTYPASQKAMTLHIAKSFPKDIINVRAEHLKRLDSAVLADINAQGETLSTYAAETQEPRERDNAIATHKQSLQRALDRGILTAVQHQALTQKFQEQTLEKNMDYWRRTDRKKMYELDRAGEYSSIEPIKHLKILEAARLDQEHEEKRAEKNLNIVKEAVVHEAAGLANQGILPQATIQQAISNQHPYITPEKGRQLNEWSNNPVSSGSTGVLAIMQEYHMGSPSMARVLETRNKLRQHAATLDRPDKHLDAALNELQNDERSAESAARAERGVRVSEMQLGIQAGKDLYGAQAEPWLPGILGQMYKAASAADQHEINTLIRNGMAPEKAVEQVVKKRKEKTNQIPDRTKGVLDLVK